MIVWLLLFVFPVCGFRASRMYIFLVFDVVFIRRVNQLRKHSLEIEASVYEIIVGDRGVLGSEHRYCKILMVSVVYIIYRKRGG